MTRPDGGDVYNVGRATSANPSAANTALSNAQIEAIFRPRGKSAPIDDYIGQINTLAQNWQVNAGTLQQTVSDPATPTSMAGLMTANTGPMKWTGPAAGFFGTKANATVAYADTVSKTMPKLQAALTSLSDGLGKSKAAFQPIFDAWGSPGSGSKATVPNDLATVLQVTIPALVIMCYEYKDQEQYNYASDGYNSVKYNAMVYTPAKNMHADPSNPYIASTFDVYAADHNGSGDYGYSGMIWCSYNPTDQYQVLQKYVVWDSSNGNNQITDKDGTAFTAGYIQAHLPQQYNIHLLDLMTITGQHFSTARSQFPPLPQPDKNLAMPTNTSGPNGTGLGTGGMPGGLGGGGAGGIPGGLGGPGGGKIKTPPLTGILTTQPPRTVTPPRPTNPPPYHLPTPAPPPSGLPGPNNPGGPNYPTGTTPPGYTSTQTAGFDPTKLPTMSSGLADPAAGLGRLPGTGGIAGGLGNLGVTGGFGGGLGGGAAGALGGPGGALSGTAGTFGPAGTALTAGETATAGQAAAAEAGAAGRMPMMPPMAPAGMNGASDRNRKSWLPEEEDLWGLAEGSAAPPVIGSDL